MYCSNSLKEIMVSSCDHGGRALEQSNGKQQLVKSLCECRRRASFLLMLLLPLWADNVPSSAMWWHRILPFLWYFPFYAFLCTSFTFMALHAPSCAFVYSEFVWVFCISILEVWKQICHSACLEGLDVTPVDWLCCKAKSRWLPLLYRRNPQRFEDSDLEDAVTCCSVLWRAVAASDCSSNCKTKQEIQGTRTSQTPANAARTCTIAARQGDFWVRKCSEPVPFNGARGLDIKPGRLHAARYSETTKQHQTTCLYILAKTEDLFKLLWTCALP